MNGKKAKAIRRMVKNTLEAPTPEAFVEAVEREGKAREAGTEQRISKEEALDMLRETELVSASKLAFFDRYFDEQPDALTVGVVHVLVILLTDERKLKAYVLESREMRKSLKKARFVQQVRGLSPRPAGRGPSGVTMRVLP